MKDDGTTRVEPPRPLVVLGALFLAYQIWGYVGWLLDDVPLERRSAGVPADVRAGVERAELMMMVAALAWFAFVAVAAVRRRRPTWPLLLTLAWAATYWQESLVNLDDRRFTYNAHFLTRGDWTPHLPFVARETPMLDQPLLMEALVFCWLIPAVGLAIGGLMRLGSRVIRPAPLLIALALVAAALFETGFEFAGIDQRLLAWNRVPEHLSLWPGTAQQWPMTEFALGFVWALPGVLWHHRHRPSLTWLDPTAGPPGLRALAVRALALAGVVNVAFLAYNLALALVPSPVTATFPVWLGG